MKTLGESDPVNKFFSMFSYLLFLPGALKTSTDLQLYKASFHKSKKKEVYSLLVGMQSKKIFVYSDYYKSQNNWLKLKVISKSWINS